MTPRLDGETPEALDLREVERPVGSRRCGAQGVSTSPTPIASFAIASG
ncbi:hypothetical protein SCE1572_36635 [Sorangium cellulosum So0157-2]|uniref:Uncharacterized protein n=1 Tax=Sorangium cellulosum So0157-2 TaxID=1254432 RepID=S4Y240_SORCE|nr:hypothetical protein SCE1572_36635 [Sorangium cellulosum So0157-2]